MSENKFIPCIPGNAPDGSWRCAVCGEASDVDCRTAPHLSSNPDDWYQPDVVKSETKRIGWEMPD